MGLSAVFSVVKSGNKYSGQCDLCQKVLTSRLASEVRSGLRRHIKEVHLKLDLYTCPYCPKTFTRKPAVPRHIKRFHVDLFKEFKQDLWGVWSYILESFLCNIFYKCMMLLLHVFIFRFEQFRFYLRKHLQIRLQSSVFQ